MEEENKTYEIIEHISVQANENFLCEKPSKLSSIKGAACMQAT